MKKLLSMTAVLTTALVLTACASNPTSSLAIQKENNQLKETLSKTQEEDSREKLGKDREIKRLETELRLTQDSAKEYRDENESLSKLNKELKFELQSYKYKVLELQKKLFDTQLTQTKELKDKEKKEKNPILKEKSR